ncbi:MAG: prepilin-type N-terminal cleavage/methylation domain-containing protein [Deltaproteobacteria bacterium]|nr:prepilin-type N-terminal cleavage/methylation domain-containing protein [Deltaproteobacteria bacterium]
MRQRQQRKQEQGFSLVELLIVMFIFSIIIAVVFESYIVQLKHTTREYKVAETEIETGIAKGIIERDLYMAGYGIADDYAGIIFVPTPKAVAATNDNPDTLTLMGTALGLKSRAAQGWSYMTAANAAAAPATASFQTWSDAREDVKANDVVILINPSTKKLLDDGLGGWQFYYNGTGGNVTIGSVAGGIAYSTPSIGTLAYGLYTSGDTPAANVPYYAVRYYLGGTPPSNCAAGTQSLLRAESRNTTSPVCGTWPCGGDPILDCVLDFEVAFGLDTLTAKGDGPINIWDPGGATIAAGYSQKDLLTRLKQIRLYILVQSGNYDPNYTSPFTSIWVGDSTLGTGRDVTLDTTNRQRNYRWKLISISITPRNIK